MTELDDFVIHANVELFIGRLRTERDPGRRDILNDMLVREVGKISTLGERLHLARRHALDNANRVERQREIVRHLDGSPEKGLAEEMLDILVRTDSLIASIQEETAAALAGCGRNSQP